MADMVIQLRLCSEETIKKVEREDHTISTQMGNQG